MDVVADGVFPEREVEVWTAGCCVGTVIEHIALACEAEICSKRLGIHGSRP